MIAENIRKSSHAIMGETLDMVRMTDIGERQFRQLAISLKNAFNDNKIELLTFFEDASLIVKCECLVKLLESKQGAKDQKGKQEYYDQKDLCSLCHSSGYRDSFEVPGRRVVE